MKITSRTILKEYPQPPWEQVVAERDMNSAWNNFKQFLKNAIDKHVPVVERTIRGRECSWLSRDIKIKMKERDYHLKRAPRTGNEIDWFAYCQKRCNEVNKKKQGNTLKNSIPGKL